MSFPRFFNAEELGKSLKEVASDILVTKHRDIKSRWFHSAQDADLFIWTDLRHNVIKQQMTFYGQVVEWNVVEGLKTGLIIEEEISNRRQGVELVRFDSKPQRTPVEQALALLDHITALQEAERQTLAQNFRQDEGLSTTMSAEHFVQRFGSFLGLSDEAAAPSAGLWARLWRWIQRGKP